VDLPVTDDLCARIVSLPVHDTMLDDDVERVVTATTRGHAR
jgi:dTDP-4-amino-4,6-dideoxygalactose transaminase